MRDAHGWATIAVTTLGEEGGTYKTFVRKLASLVVLTGERPGDLIREGVKYSPHEKSLLVVALSGRVKLKKVLCDPGLIVAAIAAIRSFRFDSKIQSLNKSVYIESAGLFGVPLRLSDLKWAYHASIKPVCVFCQNNTMGMWMDGDYGPCPGCTNGHVKDEPCTLCFNNRQGMYCGDDCFIPCPGCSESTFQP